MATPRYDFYSHYARILNSQQSHSVVLCGNVHDLFFDGSAYVPLLHFLLKRTKHSKNIQVVYELNGPIRIENNEAVKAAYIEYKSGKKPNDLLIESAVDSARGNIHNTGGRTRHKPQKSEYEVLSGEYETIKREAQGNTAVGLQFLRHLCDASRKCLSQNLQIIIEAADMMLPSGKDIASLNDKDRKRIAIVQDWFSDPAFNSGGDSVTLIAESQSLIHDRVVSLPQVLSIDVGSPDTTHRKHFIQHTCGGKPIFKGHGLGNDHTTGEQWDIDDLARLTAALSNQAIRQMLVGSFYTKEPITPKVLVEKIEDFIKAQVGDDVIEFKKPKHRLDDCVGFTNLKEFLAKHLIPRFRSSGNDALPGAAVGGPIGAGKTFIFEAVAAELGVPVIVLKNLRSQWYGQTDVIFERLRRVLEALEKVIIFVDEADTQFGGVGAETHSTERRLTGKIQAMMSDTKLRGRVTWLLMTARIHLLSPDIRRPGRVGDLIIPVLDPEGEDQREFCEWVANGKEELVEPLLNVTKGWSAAGFASLRSELNSAGDVDIDSFKTIIEDQIPPNIGPTREYQKLQALMNCTRKSLIPAIILESFGGDVQAAKQEWERELKTLEMQGIS